MFQILFTRFTNFLLDELKPTLCAFSSLFALQNIIGITDEDEIETMAEDYCSNIETTINAKIVLITNISSYEYSTSDFYDNCKI